MIEKIKKAIEYSIEQANSGDTKLPEEILNMDGMSSKKIRIFLNTLLSEYPSNSIGYLEVGLWKGSTFISALYKNTNIARADGIDNFSEFVIEDVKSKLHQNLRKFNNELCKDNYIHDKDFNDEEVTQSLYRKGKYDIYFYDGGHSVDAQKNAFIRMDKVLNETFVAIVDDWNMPSAKEGTMQSFAELGYNILHSWELESDYNGDYQKWWNGFYIAIIRKGK
jgi:hypothetical protein